MRIGKSKFEKPKTDFSVTYDQGLAILRFLNGVFGPVESLQSKSELLDQLVVLGRAPEVKAVVLLNEPGSLRDEVYQDYLKRIAGEKGLSSRFNSGTELRHSMALVRFGNALLQLVRTLEEMDKLVVAGLAGQISAPFFGVALAADYRVASKDMTFYPSHHTMGFLPGGGPGFKTENIGSPLAIRDLLLSRVAVTASELNSKGLIDEIREIETFEWDVVQFAADLTRIPLAAIQASKRAWQGWEDPSAY